MIKTIIFDVGGTLVDGPDLFRTISAKIKEFYDLDIEQELLQEFKKIYAGPIFYDVKTILDEITTIILKKQSIYDSKIKSSEIYKDLFLNQSFLFSDSVEILEFLKEKNVKLIIVSDADADVLVPELKKLKIYDYFDEILISSDIKCYKTSEKIIKHILPKIKEPFDEILFVGDTKADIDTAKRLKVKSVFINRKYDKEMGDFTIKNLSELKKFWDV